VPHWVPQPHGRDGESTCRIGSAPETLKVQPGMTCCLISATYNITIPQLLAQNPGLKCSRLKPGQVVNTSNPSYQCAVAYTVTSDRRTFDAIRPPCNPLMMSLASLRMSCKPSTRLPAARLTASFATRPVHLCPGWHLAGGPHMQPALHHADRGQLRLSDGPPLPSDPIPFYGLNPGLDCGLVSDRGANSGVGATGVTVCVGSEPVGVGTRKCPLVTPKKGPKLKTFLYIGKGNDSCPKVLNNRCKKFKDKMLFGAKAFLNLNPAPHLRATVTGYQFCCP